MADTYNYHRFDEHVAEGQDEAAETAFRQSVQVGQRGIDAELTRLDDGGRLRLSSLWRSGPLVVEFGSFT